MRKLLPIAASTALVLALSMPAMGFADGTGSVTHFNTGDGNTVKTEGVCVATGSEGSINVTDSHDVDVVIKDNVAKVYSVNLTWDKPEFTYTVTSQRWDPDTHKYTTEGSWTNDTVTVKATNNSNAAVNVVATLELSDELFSTTGVTASLDNVAQSSIVSAVGLAVNDDSLNKTYTVTAQGTPIVDSTYTNKDNKFNAGTVTIAISAAE